MLRGDTCERDAGASDALKDTLKTLEPRLEELSGGRGRAMALAARTRKTLLRYTGSNDAY